MRPSQAIVYHNANEHYDPLRSFPKPGRGDALGNYGDTITTLVDLRNRYGRGDYRERYLEKENYAFERSNAALVMLSNRNDSGYDSRTMNVDFALGARLVELTGNAAAANATLGAGTIPEVLEVIGTAANRYVNGRFLRNSGKDQGYLVYGLPTPRSSAGIEFSGTGVGAVIAGDVPPTFQGGETSAQITAIHEANATSRLADMRVITGNAFTVRLATQAVTLAGGYRDRSADGDQAMIRINEGLDLNGSGGVDVTAPGDVSYGFENFTTTRVTGFSQANGNGLYEQAVDATVLPEGMNFLTVRAYRQRGDGGPAVYSDFKEVLYVDRVKPESSFDQFVPFTGGTGNNDVWLRSTDGTADRVNVFQNVAAAVSDATILSWVNAGQGSTDKIDRDTFKTGFFGVPNGNNSYTVVTREITGTVNIQRFTGRRPATGRGAGFGDLNFDGIRDAGDITGTSHGFERVLFSKNAEFNAAADVTGDGLVDTRDLLQLEGLLTGTANAAAASALSGVKFRRANFVNDAVLNETDLGVLRASVAQSAGADTWTFDLDADGVIGEGDVQMAQQQFGVAPSAGVPASLSWTGNDAAAGGSGVWSTAGLAWRGAVTDAALPMPLVPGSRAVFSGAGVVVTVSGSVVVTGGLDIRSTGLATFAGTGPILLGGTTQAAREVSVADGSSALVATRITGSNGLLKTGSGRLTLSASNSFTGTTTITGGTFVLGNGASTGSVSGPIDVGPAGVVAFNRNNAFVLTNAISGSGSVAQIGSGITTMTVANTHAGRTTVQAGTLRIEHPDALASSPTTVAGGRLEVGSGVRLRTTALTLAGGAVTAPAVELGASGVAQLVLESGSFTAPPAVTIAAGGRMTLSSSQPQDVDLAQLSIADGLGGGSLDLGLGTIAIASGGMSASSLVSALAAGRGDGGWNGSTGIRSSAVAAAVGNSLPRSIGWLERADGSLLVGFAAPGDSNIDGLVDILDIGNVASNFNGPLAGSAVWEQGDFNYDGFVDMLDVADILAVDLFNGGDYRLAAAAGGGLAAVPEPSALMLMPLAVAVAAWPWRDRRTSR